MKSKDIEEIYANYEISNGIYNEINQSNDLDRIRRKWAIFSLINKDINVLDKNNSSDGQNLNENNCAA
ncbi:hypothetical protein ACXJY6_12535 [Vibrio sp. RC27]